MVWLPVTRVTPNICENCGMLGIKLMLVNNSSRWMILSMMIIFLYLEITNEWWCSSNLWRLILYALAAWSLWSSWLHSVWDWSAPLPECILQWHDWGCRGWRLTQCWICFPYYPWNCTSWSLWIVGIWPGSAAVEGNPVFQALKFPFLREIYVPSVNMSCSAFNKP